MIGFRVDANENIASGHMVRCITIAKEFSRFGQESLFYLAEDKETWRLKSSGIQYKILNSNWKKTDEEIEKLVDNIINDCIEWLFVDSYQVDNEYLTYLNNFCKVIYMDDMALCNYNIFAVIHYGLFDRKYVERYEDTNTLCLTGPQFIPLREEFYDDSYKINREKSILVTTGGTDKYGVTLKFLKCFAKNDLFRDYEVYAIIGSMNEYEKDIMDFAQKEKRIYILKNINNISYYMKKCEFAVSAGGTTLYELCACKTPTICFSFADNQYEFAKRMETDNIMLFAGDPRYNKEIDEKIMECLVKMKKDLVLKHRCIHNMESLIDGKGVTRIVKRILEI